MKKRKRFYMYFHPDNGIFYFLRRKNQEEAIQTLEEELDTKITSECHQIFYIEYLIMKLPCLPQIKVMDLDHKERGVELYGKG